MTERFAVDDGDGPLLAGELHGTGDPLLLLHGGPGLGAEYLAPLVAELAPGWQVATYQQRGLEPSGTEGPFEVADHVDDVRRVLDALGWEQAVVVGHSWGGHLAVAVAVALPDRLRGVLAVDPLGAVGDGEAEAFEQALFERTPEPDRARAAALDAAAMAGEGTIEDALESLRLVWPAYYADPSAAPPVPEVRISLECYAGTWDSLVAGLPALESALPGVVVPVGFVHGLASPMLLEASSRAAARIPGAWVEEVAGAGHFVWHEAPGAVAAAVERLTR